MARPTHDGFIQGKGAWPHTWLIERAVLDHLGEADLEAACEQSSTWQITEGGRGQGTPPRNRAIRACTLLARGRAAGASVTVCSMVNAL